MQINKCGCGSFAIQVMEPAGYRVACFNENSKEDGSFDCMEIGPLDSYERSVELWNAGERATATEGELR